MRGKFWLPAVAAVAMLGGCGGGGVSSTPTPPSTPTPAPTNTTLGNLRVNQDFATDASSGTTAIDKTTVLVTGPSVTARSTVQVHYDAAAGSYTIQGPARTQTFAAADIQAGTEPGETRYYKTDGTNRDYLTLVVTPYTSTNGTPNQYVGLGYWQRNTGTGNTQNTSFDSFVYGFATPAGAVPRTGTAGYVTDTLGFVTTPGKPPRAFLGAGTFNVDFGQGLFSAHTSVTEYELASPASVSGGGIEFSARGHLGSGNGFTGNFTYGGWDGQVSGSIGGRFYGPGAEELGASFSADNAAGAAVTGSLTGRRDPNVPAVNQALTNLVADQLFYVTEARVTVGAGAGHPTNLYSGIGQFTLRPDGSLALTSSTSEVAFLQATAADRITDSRANFITYQKMVDGTPTQLSLYRSGSANTELALTYVSFGDWSTIVSAPYSAASARHFFAYGIEPERSLLARRTGTASYAGVAYGAGVRTDGLAYDVRGTSHFDVDFSNQNYTGSLALNGTPTGGGAAADFGTWTFASPVSSGQLVQTQLHRAGLSDNIFSTISPRFYGPDAEEIGGSFALQTGVPEAAGTVQVVGVTVAKRQ